MTERTEDSFLLLNPGPVPITDAVMDAMHAPMVSHRSAAFESAFERAATGLDYIFSESTIDGSRTSTGGTSLILNGTATMGMEAAVANLVEPDSTVVTIGNGKFGRRFERIADRYCQVESVHSEWGEPIDLDAVSTAITDDTDVVTMVHNETSTGILNPVAEVGALAAEHDARFVVDAVTSIGGDEFRVDDWNVDIVITDAQKALAAPPGISAMYVTDHVVEYIDGEAAPFYQDLDWHLRKAMDNQTPFTGAVPLVRALAVAVEQIVDEGMPDRIRRHRRQSAAFRNGFQAMGLAVFPETPSPSAPSNTVTAISIPEPLQSADRSSEFFEAVRARNVSISGGQAHLGGQIFRVSNMGNISDDQIRRGIRTVGEALTETGVTADIDAALAVADDELSG